MGGKTSTTVKDRYNRKKYDSILIRVPSGSKQIVQDAADNNGQSVNDYVSCALLDRLKMSGWDQKNEN